MAETEENEARSYELAFEEAGRALDAQERAVNELRSRAGVLIAAAAITTSFLGSRAITGDGLSVWVWVAVVAFIVVGGSVLTVLWPRTDWSFSAQRGGHHRGVRGARTRGVPARSARPRPPPVRRLRPQRPSAGSMFLVFRLGLIVLVVEVAAWIVALAERA